MLKRSHVGDEAAFAHSSKRSRVATSVPRSPAEKIEDLMSALLKALDDEGVEEFRQEIGENAYRQCAELRVSLQLGTAAKAAKPKSTLSPLSLTPWKSHEIPVTLPPLPQILDPTLEAAAFTHQGISTGRISDLSYERLEWVGDAYLELTATLLISQTFPSLLPGKSSQIRELLVKNVTLHGYAREYGFHKRARFPEETMNNPKGQGFIKMMADVFEAYVAAVILSDPENGASRATDWLKKLWSMTIKEQIIEEERHGIHFDNPMWRLRGDVGEVEISSSEPPQLNHKDRLQKLLGAAGVKISYKDVGPPRMDPTKKAYSYKVGVYLDGYGYKDRCLGVGTSTGKKEAGNLAALDALAQNKAMEELLEKKTVHDAIWKRKKESLEEARVGGEARSSEVVSR